MKFLIQKLPPLQLLYFAFVSGWGSECSIPPSEEEIFDDTDESGNKLNAGFDCCVWCLELWEDRCGGGLGGCGVGFPWASSASRLRRFMTVGRNLDEMARSPASCRYHKIRNHLWYPFGIMVLRFHLGICGKMMHDEYKELKQLFHNVTKKQKKERRDVCSLKTQPPSSPNFLSSHHPLWIM